MWVENKSFIKVNVNYISNITDNNNIKYLTYYDVLVSKSIIESIKKYKCRLINNCTFSI